MIKRDLIDSSSMPMMRTRSRNINNLALSTYHHRLARRLFFPREQSTQTTGITSRKLEGKVALITGAASGIGRATAEKFIQNGAKVLIADVQTELGRATATQLGDNADFIHCDVTSESDISAAVHFAVEKHQKLDIMFNNAGIACQTPASIVDLDLSVYDRVMAVNVRGVVAGIKHAARVMIPRRSGSILCTASVTGLMGGLAQHTYSLSKFAVAGIVKSMAAELCQHGIRINCVSPFAIPTAFVMEEMRQIYPRLSDAQIRAVVRGSGVLEGAEIEAADVANAALYLVSADAKYVSGHNLVVDGGFTAFKSIAFPSPNEL